MFCKTCGKELNIDDKFCSRCGSKVEIIEDNLYEEVVFNPPFKLEQANTSKEVVQEEPKQINKFDTIDFSWDLSGFPTNGENTKKEVEDFAFNWDFPPRKPAMMNIASAPKEETEVKVEEKQEDKPEEKQEEVVAEVIDDEKENSAPITFDTPDEIELIQEKEFEEEMPKGNGITVEDFLEELKNHVPREERLLQEGLEGAEEETKITEQISNKVSEGRKGLMSFFKAPFASQTEEEEIIEEEPVLEEEQLPEEETATEEILEPEVEIEVPSEETEEVLEPEVPSEEVEEETPFEEIDIEDKTISNLMEQEINDFLPEDKQEKEETTGENLDATRIVDKFYTFNKKNVEFQQLLDQEYEKIRGDKPIEQVKAEIKQSNMEAGQFARDALEMKEAGKLEAGQKPNWDDIFGEENENEEPKKKSKAGKMIGILILILAIIAGGGYATVKFLPDTGAATIIEKYFDKAMELIKGQPEQSGDEVATIETYIDQLADLNKGISRISYNPKLIINTSKDYGISGLEDSKAFADSAMKDEDGNQSTIGKIITSKLIEKYSDKATAKENQKMELLQIGDYRSSEKGFYAITSYRMTDTEEGTTKTQDEIVYLVFKGEKIVIKHTEKI